jgi:hypothetical protein
MVGVDATVAKENGIGDVNAIGGSNIWSLLRLAA